jgi:hypothetical protein
MNIARYLVIRETSCRAAWALAWKLKHTGALQTIYFFTRKEAEIARTTIVAHLIQRSIDPCALPRAAVLITLHAICEGHDGVEFVPADNLSSRSPYSATLRKKVLH